MPRRKKPEKKPHFDDLSSQTKQAIGAIALLFLAVFLTLSLLGYAGMAGDWTFVALDFLFGGGAYLAPVVCAFYIYALLNPKEDENVSTSKVLGIALMFTMLLTGLSLYARDFGGITGLMFEYPLTYLLGPLASSIVASALFIIGIFLTFDTGLHISSLFRKKEAPDDEAEDEEDFSSLAESDAEEEEGDDEAEEEEPKPKKSIGEKLGGKIGITKDTGFLVTSFEGHYDPPPLSLLNKGKGKPKTGDAKANSNIIKQTLKNFGIQVEMDQVEVGPTVTRYALKPAQGVKIARIVGLQRELELNLASGTIRIEAPIPGKSLVGIEVPNIERASIGLASLLASPEFTDSPNPLLVALGKDITGNANFANVARMPHALIAGTTGSGKSVMIHNLIVSLLYRNSPNQLRFIMVDPKRVELTLYNGIPHLMTGVVTEAKKALLALKWAIKEMERRYDILQSCKVQNLASYHKNVYRPAKEEFDKSDLPEEEREELPEPLPYIVIVMDELADLMHAYPRELEASIVRLAQMSRAVGIHLILATQRPSVNVITGTIKANIPTRIALQVASQIDSRTIIDQTGAEKLLGQGDALFLSAEMNKPIRLQSAFISENELKKVVEYLKNQSDAQELDSIDLEAKAEGGTGDAFFASIAGAEEEDDDLYEDAKQAVIDNGKASTSYIQRKLRVGYSRAARLMDILEERGVIGPQDGSRPREILTQENIDDESDEEDVDVDDESDEEENR